jgi:iron-sulfur cluster repair protein YtfE (RIC family)
MNTQTLLTEPVRAEHRDLLPHIEELRQTARWSPTAPSAVIHERLAHTIEFFRHQLVPHAHAEEQVLYPAVEEAMHAPGAARTMTRDHVAVVRMVAELEALRDELEEPPTDQQRDRLTELLFSLHAVIALHFAKEEEIYLPVLDASLDPVGAARLFARMEDAERSFAARQQ